MNIFRQKTYAKDLWKVLGSFGELTAEVECKENTFSSQNDKISLIAKIEKGKDGVFSRNDILKNISSEPLSINTLSSKFTLDGGEYEVFSIQKQHSMRQRNQVHLLRY